MKNVTTKKFDQMFGKWVITNGENKVVISKPRYGGYGVWDAPTRTYKYGAPTLKEAILRWESSLQND